jgi:hypothetical protein
MAPTCIAWERVAPGSARDRLRRFTVAELRRLAEELHAKSVAASAVPSLAEPERGADDRRRSQALESGAATPSKPEDPS